MGLLQQYKDDFILLAEAGFVAVNQADEDAAVKLFKASETLSPNNVLPKVGIGYMHLCKLELKQASKSFEEVLAKDSGNETAKALLGLSLSLNPQELAKGEKVLEEASAHSKDPGVQKLAKSALEFVEKFVKRTPSPVQGESHSKKDNKPKKDKNK